MVKVLLDTSILFHAAIQQHSLHQASLRLVVSLRGEESTQACFTTHAIAELYNHLSRGRVQAVSPAKVRAILEEARAWARPVALGESVYFAAVQRCQDLELDGSVIYDALHFEAALAQGCSAIYTDNARDFERLLRRPDEIIVRTASNPLE